MQINVTFDSISELDEFIARMGAPSALISGTPAPHTAPIVLDTFPDAIPPDEALTPAQVIEEHEPAVEEKPQRKRRTKAEMEAIRAAESAEPETTPAAVQETPAAAAPIVNEGNPFAAGAPAANAAIQAALAGAPAGQTLAALAEVSVQEQPVVVAKSVKPTDPEHIKTWLHDTAVGNIGPLDMGSHMARAKAFIAKNGNAKYNESFVVAGLDPNIMVYSDEQRSLHAAALEFVDWS